MLVSAPMNRVLRTLATVSGVQRRLGSRLHGNECQVVLLRSLGVNRYVQGKRNGTPRQGVSTTKSSTSVLGVFVPLLSCQTSANSFACQMIIRKSRLRQCVIRRTRDVNDPTHAFGAPNPIERRVSMTNIIQVRFLYLIRSVLRPSRVA